jgi:hypothetical protein
MATAANLPLWNALADLSVLHAAGGAGCLPPRWR